MVNEKKVFKIAVGIAAIFVLCPQEYLLPAGIHRLVTMSGLFNLTPWSTRLPVDCKQLSLVLLILLDNL